jgi:hypothetical protein
VTSIFPRHCCGDDLRLAASNRAEVANDHHLSLVPRRSGRSESIPYTIALWHASRGQIRLIPNPSKKRQSREPQQVYAAYGSAAGPLATNLVCTINLAAPDTFGFTRIRASRVMPLQGRIMTRAGQRLRCRDGSSSR